MAIKSLRKAKNAIAAMKKTAKTHVVIMLATKNLIYDVDYDVVHNVAQLEAIVVETIVNLSLAHMYALKITTVCMTLIVLDTVPYVRHVSQSFSNRISRFAALNHSFASMVFVTLFKKQHLKYFVLYIFRKN